MKPSKHPWIKTLLFPLMGLATLVWFLVRVIPKPSRANYPCMKAAAPIMSGFVLWLIALVGSVTFFKKAKSLFNNSRHALAFVAMGAGLVLGLVAMADQAPKLFAASMDGTVEGPGKPMGEGVGVNKGRVVWVHDTDATNENYMSPGIEPWFSDKNTNLEVVRTMLGQGIISLAGKPDIKAAWDALFRYFNAAHGKADQGYTKGEKFVIKTNLNGMGNGRSNINTSPQVTYAILDQLVNVVGVPQSDIWCGDPNINFDRDMYRMVWAAFPDVHYFGKAFGMTKPRPSRDKVLFASDGGKSDPLPQAYLDASYLINIPVLKKHHRGGISLAAKNHFGSITPFNGNGAFGWHYSLPVPDGGADNSNGKYGEYRCFVDMTGHKDMGGKTILYIIDGLWSSINWGHPAIKWRMPPFNNDLPNSLLISQDPVAVDSVGFDFLRTEFDSKHPTEGRYDPRDDHGPFPQYKGIDDYLHQAADSANWPTGLVYDPENDGTPLPKSMGAHEHWNNPVDKKYTRNLGGNKGIELLPLELSPAVPAQ